MQIKITLQPEIYEQVKKNSKANMRTLSAEINFMLQKAYDVSKEKETTPPTTPPNTKPKREGDLW